MKTMADYQDLFRNQHDIFFSEFHTIVHLNYFIATDPTSVDALKTTIMHLEMLTGYIKMEARK